MKPQPILPWGVRFERWLEQFGEPNDPYEHALRDFRDFERRQKRGKRWTS